jgi:hypothetical protein
LPRAELNYRLGCLCHMTPLAEPGIQRTGHALDQVKLVAQLRGDIVGQAFAIAGLGTFPSELF